MTRLLLLTVVVCACGGSSSPTTAAPGPPAPMVASGAAPDDVIVAQVNGRPVWGSCVATQAKRSRTKLTAKQALDECVEFELLAQAAEGKQLATHGEVIEATRIALVGRLVDQFDAKYSTPDSMAAQIDEVYRTQGAALTRPELRGSSHLLVAVEKDPKKPSASAATWEQARPFAIELHAKLAQQTGLFASHLGDAIKGVTPPPQTELRVDDLPPVPKHGALTPEYLDALFAIPEVGQVSPVTRTPYGYHVILLTDLRPAETLVRDQVFAALRGRLFATYVAGLMNSVTHESHPELLEDPAEGDQRAGEQ